MLSVCSHLIAPIAIEEDGTTARRWPQQWFEAGRSWLDHPSASNLYWLRLAGLDLPDDVRPEAITDELEARVCAAFGRFGIAEQCLDRLARAQQEAGVAHAFLFPGDTLEGGYDMPAREVEAFRRIIHPRVPQR